MKDNATFGVIGAMSIEIGLLRAALSGVETQEHAGLTFYRGALGSHTVVLVQSGVGKVNAARCTQLLIDRFAPDYIVNTGIAGGVGKGLAIADVVIGTELVQHDFDVSFFGYARGNLCSSKDGKPTVYAADPELADAFRAAAEELAGKARVKTGRIASGDQFVAERAVKRDIADAFGALACEMEGAAVAQTAALAGVPFVVVRAISDLADGSDEALSETFDRDAADLSAGILKKLILG
jgi:adenosylhomocysteine nucleosidase